MIYFFVPVRNRTRTDAIPADTIPSKVMIAANFPLCYNDAMSRYGKER